jgi:hypothetical protein
MASRIPDIPDLPGERVHRSRPPVRCALHPSLRGSRIAEHNTGAEEALAQGETPHFESAIPTWYDAFFSLCERRGVLAQIEALRDPRTQPAVPLPLLIVLTMYRFLQCHQSFRRVGEVLLKNQARLQRLGVAPVICEHGYYRHGERKPFDEECFSKVFRLLGEGKDSPRRRMYLRRGARRFVLWLDGQSSACSAV